MYSATRPCIPEVSNDNGTIVDVQPGDVYYCGDGECHSIEAIGEPIEMIALILYTT